MEEDKMNKVKSYNTFNYLNIKENLFVQKQINKVIKIINIPNCRKLIKINDTEIDLRSWSNGERWFYGDKMLAISKRNFNKEEILWLSKTFEINLDSQKAKGNCKNKDMIIKKVNNQDFLVLIFCLSDFEKEPFEKLYIFGIWKSKLPKNIAQKFNPNN